MTRRAITPLDSGNAGRFVVELAHFSGPLDLLLSLIREEQVEIYDIPIARICEQFLAAHSHARAGRSRRISRDGRAAAAHQGADAPAAPRRRRGMGRPARGARAPAARVPADARSGRRARATAATIGATASRAPTSTTAGTAPHAPLALSLAELLAAVDRVLRAARKPTLHEVVPRALDVDGAIDTIRAVLAHRGAARGGATSSRANAEPWQVLSALLALLELARRSELARAAQTFCGCGDSRVNSLAKLLEAALFASATADPRRTSWLHSTPTRRPKTLRSRAGRNARALRRRGARRRARGAGRRLADPHAAGIHRGDRARAASRRARSASRRAALETLAIIAYRQPIGRAEVEDIRGVDAGADSQVAARARADRCRRRAAKDSGVRCCTARRRSFSNTSRCGISASCRAPTSSRSRCAREPQPL